MRAPKEKALSGGAAQRLGGEQPEQKLRAEYSTADCFRIAFIRAHLIRYQRGGPERKRAILHFLAALKCALGVSK